MALPKIDLPIFTMTLPHSGEAIKYRPFTVKEEKILLVAQESADAEQELVAAKQIIGNCLIDKNVDELTMFEIEYVLLMIRARSVSNQSSFTVTDPETEEVVTLELDLDELKLEIPEGHKNEIKINDEFTLFLKYPIMDDFIKIITMDPNDPLANYYIIVTCLDKIASNDEIHYFKDYSQEDIDAFMDSMSGDVIKGIEEFFNTMPRLRHEMKYTNKNGNEQTFVIEGMRSFFI